MTFSLNCLASCTWSLTSEVIVTRRRQQPTGGKESAPAPNPWPGETHTHCKNAEALPAAPGLFTFIAVYLSSSHFAFLPPCLRWSLRLQKPQRDAAVWCVCCCECLCAFVCDVWVSFVASEVCVCVSCRRPFPRAKKRNHNHSAGFNWPLSTFASCFLRSPSHLFLCVSLRSLEIFLLV